MVRSIRCALSLTFLSLMACSNTPGPVAAGPPDGAATPRCVPGAKAACACADGASGAQRCRDDGSFAPCVCAAAPRDADRVPRCVPGMEVACACADGGAGAQRCSEAGAYGACACDAPAPRGDAAPDAPASPDVADAPDAASPDVADARDAASAADTPDARDAADAADARDASDALDVFDVPARDAPDVGDAAADAADVVRVDAGGAPSVVLSAGADALIDAFATPAGILVVHAGHVALVDRGGAELRRWTPPREITAAAFDGTYLAVADRAVLNVLSPSLEERGSAPLTDTCVTGVIVSGPRFVCGPAADWDRVFYVHELPSGRQLARSAPYTYQGTPMRRVTGRDDFTTVTTNLSPSDIYLQRVTADGQVVSFGDSPYHGDFSVTDTYAFVGDPATHVLTVGGILLQIYASGCESRDAGFRGGCFTRDGTVGTLRAGERFVALTEVGATSVAALVDRSGTFDLPCQSGCDLQRIDVPGRAVSSTRSHAVPSLQRVTVVRYDAHADRLLLGYSTGDRFGGATGHRLLMLSF